MILFFLLALTIIIEFFLVAIVLKLWWKKEQGIKKIFLYSLLANMVTQPIVNVLSGSGIWNFWNLNLLIYLEVFAIVVEGIILAKLFELNYKHGLLLSILANILSVSIGLFIIPNFFFRF